MHRRAQALAAWRSDTALTVTLSATTGFVVLILGFAFHWQATRAREADVIYETVRTRIDTALNRGRCGLWDWDLARGRIFWSHSMFAILGLKPQDELLSFGEVNALVHPEDLHLYQLAAQLAEAKTTRRPRLPHAPRQRQLGVAARALRTRAAAGRSGPHLIGIAVDITEQKTLVERTAEADCACATPSRPSPRRSCCGMPTTAWCCATPISWRCTTSPPRRSRREPPTMLVVAAGRKPVVLAKVDQRRAGARRPHLRGPARGRPLAAHQRAPHQRWRLCVGRHRHHHVKRHEEKLMQSEQRLIKTISDLRASQRTLRASGRRARGPGARNIPTRGPAPKKPTRRNRASSPI